MSQLIPGAPVHITSGRHRGRRGIIKQPERTLMWPDANGLVKITLAADARRNAPVMDAYFLTTQFSLTR
jgi:hypothetical protein